MAQLKMKKFDQDKDSWTDYGIQETCEPTSPLVLEEKASLSKVGENLTIANKVDCGCVKINENAGATTITISNLDSHGEEFNYITPYASANTITFEQPLCGGLSVGTGISFKNGSGIQNNNKEEKKMAKTTNIVNLWEKREREKNAREIVAKREEIYSSDPFLKMLKDTTTNNPYLDEEEKEGLLEIVNNTFVSKGFYTKQTEKKLIKLNTEGSEKSEALSKKLEEVRVLIEAANDYFDEMSILQNYGIVTTEKQGNYAQGFTFKN